jgi:HAD superfamily hydrolase (TIGR01450 family)
VGWVIDLDGVIWTGDRPVPGAAGAVTDLLTAGEEVLFVTNMSAQPVACVEEKLARHGVDAVGRVVTSAMAVARLVTPGERVLACAGPGVVEALTRAGATVVASGPADAVVVGYHREFDYERMTTAAQAVMGGARLLATNDDATYPTERGIVPGNGAILASIATASGAVAAVAGKPHRPICDLIRDRIGRDGIVVGDRADTDGRFAAALGFRFALVLTGVTRRQDLPVEPRPHIVAADLGEVVRRHLGAP